MKKIYVLCPGDVVTGGPELLHQLVHSINKQGGNASIVYYPFNEEYEVPDAYNHYNVNKKHYDEIIRCDAKVVLPESQPALSKKFSDFDVYIWWMSVDNYLNQKPKGIRSIINYIFGKSSYIPMRKMKGLKHLVQSFYAKEYLKQFGYKSEMLTDYLNKEHLNKSVNINSKENIVVYNPKKGFEVTSKLIEYNPGLKFVPIQNMTSVQVADLLAKSKVYIDFGMHPGKDRIPREAAMAGCVVITGTKGSAKNSIDIPVDSKYKIDECRVDFLQEASETINDSLLNYQDAYEQFSCYRDSIRLEHEVFDEEVKRFMLDS